MMRFYCLACNNNEAIVTVTKAALQRDKDLIAGILSNPPFDALDIQTLNFLRNNAPSTSSVKINIDFKDQNDQIIFQAQVSTGHSGMNLRPFGIEFTLQQYKVITGQETNWHSAHVHPNFEITATDLNEWAERDDFVSLNRALLSSDMPTIEVIHSSMNALSKLSKESAQPLTRDQIERPFLAMHVALLRDETSCTLKDARGHEIKRPTLLANPLKWASRLHPRFGL
jgi:hypothetical protein